MKRTMNFNGKFSDPGKRRMEGSYQETIVGLKDIRGNDIPIILNGNFVLFFSTSKK
ncbi:MAG: hypothetical protein NG747_11975 [Candidatus Brocadia sp.]|nr:hypothetical protein [Candidatus Brocadia sp.]